MLMIHGICGSSKKMMAIYLGILACNNFMKVIFFTISQLLECLMEADIYEAVKHAFPDILTEEKQYKKLSNLLQKMKKEGVVHVRGSAVHAECFLVE